MNALPKKRSRQPEQRIDYKNTPCFPTEVYENLPVFLKENCKLFKTDREKDVFLSSALCVLSASLSNLSGLYHGRETYPNLYSLILAPAASGKSVMSYARMLGEAYEASLQQQYQAEKSKFDKAIQEGQHPEALKRPKRALFFIPANSSASRVIEHLKEGQGSGLICETEADTLGNVLKQDWGGYSDILRKAYSGEPISHSRQTGNAYVSLIKTRLSVLMTGTLNQLFELIPSAENGLFSRFFFFF